MATKIEWCDETWNPITGCSPVSEGCKNCYAERMAKRLAGRCGYPKDNPFAVTHHLEKLDLPRRWRKPRRVFIGSMGDLFHPDVPETTLRAIFYEMSAWNLQHTFMILTKRPERMKAQIDKWIADGVIFRDGVKDRLTNNIWLGVTAENQRTADERIPILLSIPAAVRFVSCEPLLGEINIEDYFPVYDNRPTYPYWQAMFPEQGDKPILEQAGVDWVICGGETGPRARPMKPDWAYNLREQCIMSMPQIPFFFKQWGGKIKKVPSCAIRYGYEKVESTRQFPREAI